MAGNRIVEVRTYKLKPGSGPEFHRLVVEESVPQLEAWGTDVVAYGPSLSDPEGYFLIRAYASVEELEASQDGFYASDAWRKGPREAIVARIENSTGAAFELSDAAIEAMRS